MDEVDFARQLRRRQTDAERRIWGRLRDRRFFGLKFRRRVPCGIHVLDFYCHELRLAAELDGGQHLESAHDRERDVWLAGQGIRVLRYWNHDVLVRTDAVLEALRVAVESGAG